MSVNELMSFMDHYGLLFLFGIVFLEYLNMPGFPAGIIFPATGVWLATADESFFMALAVSVAAGVIGSLMLYYIGKKGGPVFIEKLKRKRPALGPKIDKYSARLLEHANSTVFFSKLLPVVRTLIGLPAGAVGINLKNYLIFSTLGITIWNGGLILVGVFFGDMIFEHFG